MLSGALLLNKTFESGKDVIRFYKRNFIPLVICVELWNVLNRCFYHFFYNTPFSYVDLVKELLFLQTSPLSHMWYMPMIIGMYLTIPFLSVAIQKFETYVLLIPLSLITVINFIFPVVNRLNEVASILPESISLKLDMSFWGGVYGVYLILGYLIAQRDLLRKVSNKILFAVFVVALISLLVMQYYLYVNHCGKNLLWYSCINILILGVILFEWLKRFGQKFYIDIFQTISILSLGIYFFHKPILMIFVKSIISMYEKSEIKMYN